VKGYVIRIDGLRTHGWQAKWHAWSGVCMDEMCPCRVKASRLFSDRKSGGTRKAKRLAKAWFKRKPKELAR
jgi:hypothetical protein